VSGSWLLARRGLKREVDAERAFGWLFERERTPDLGVLDSLSVFLVGAECPFGCVFCDLWRYTLDGPTPAGALPRQLERALAEAQPPIPALTLLKLYNASNFWDPRAVPSEDEPRLLELAEPFARVVVENHPRLVRERCLALAAALGPKLEVAMGLETVHPEALPRLGKGMTLEDFDRACRRLREAGASLRAFVLVGAPFVPPTETIEWAVRSVEHAFRQGVGTVSLIPVRGGNGQLEQLAAGGKFTPPTLTQLEEALDRALALQGGVVTADLWDLERFTACSVCATLRRERLERLSLTGAPESRVACVRCAA
jgi:archaeosine synthase beta-subunit